MARSKKVLKFVFGAFLLVFILIQFWPEGMDHTNPPVTGYPNWGSAETEQLIRRACFDCHSNETKWPWYASIAPVSWRVENHVKRGRAHLNFSEFNKTQRHAPEAAWQVQKGYMPLQDYLWLHPEARLTDEEKAALIRGLREMFGEP